MKKKTIMILSVFLIILCFAFPAQAAAQNLYILDTVSFKNEYSDGYYTFSKGYNSNWLLTYYNATDTERSDLITYDAKGRVSKIGDRKFSYNKKGNLKKCVNTDIGSVRHIKYKKKRVISYWFDRMPKTNVKFDSKWRPVKSSFYNSQVTTYKYDKKGNLIQIQRKSGENKKIKETIKIKNTYSAGRISKQKVQWYTNSKLSATENWSYTYKRVSVKSKNISMVKKQQWWTINFRSLFEEYYGQYGL